MQQFPTLQSFKSGHSSHTLPATFQNSKAVTTTQCYDHPFLFLFLVPLCFPFILLLVECLIPTIHNSFTLFYPNIFGTNRSFLEYSPQNIPLYYLTFYCLLLLSISFVIPPTINIYKSHSSFLSFPTLVYLVLLALIDPLVTSPWISTSLHLTFE